MTAKTVDLTLVFVRNGRHDVVSISYENPDDFAVNRRIKEIVKDKAEVGATLYTALYGANSLAADMYNLDPMAELMDGNPAGYDPDEDYIEGRMP